MSSAPERILPRALLLAIALLLAVSAGLWAQGESQEESEEWENPVETPIEIQSVTVTQKLDSVFAQIDEQFKLIRPILETSCFDCHSTTTELPWYAKLPGIKQFINGHVTEGREHLDMTDGFPFKGKGEQLEILRDVHKEVSSGDMPLLSYRLMHWGAWLSSAERDSILEFVDTSVVMLERFYDREHIPYSQHDDSTSVE